MSRPHPADGEPDRERDGNPAETALDRLTRQVERGGIFTNTALGRGGPNSPRSSPSSMACSRPSSPRASSRRTR